MPDPIPPTPAPVTPPAGTGTTTPPPAAAAPSGGEPKDQPAGSQPKSKAPDKYELTLPKDSLLDQAALDDVAAYAKEKGLTNEEAQEIIEGENARFAAFVDKQKVQQKEAWKKINDDWITELKNDKEFGPEFVKNSELGKRVIERFGDEQLKKDLNPEGEGIGYGNYPGLMRMMAKIGKAMSEDTLRMPGAAPAGDQKKSSAEVLYPNQK